MEKDKFLFNSDEEFEFFIGHTQAYVNMQNEISKVVKFAHPEYLIEFGSGSGKTCSDCGVCFNKKVTSVVFNQH